MSSPSAAQQRLIGSYLEMSASVLYLYESCITFTKEIEVIWRRKWTAMTWLYIFTRYNGVLIAIFSLIPGWNYTSCRVIVYTAGALGLVQFLCAALFGALRVYALLDGKLLVAGITLLLGLVPVAVNIYTGTTVVPLWFANIKVCTLFLGGADSLSLSLATRIVVIATDALVLIVTWYKTIQLYVESRRMQLKTPLATLLIRDGTLYFLILLAINIYVPVANTIPIFIKLNISTFALRALPPIISCRFILNLRQVRKVDDPNSQELSSSSVSIRFVGNMGQSLHVGVHNEWEKEDIEVHPACPEELDIALVIIGEGGDQ